MTSTSVKVIWADFGSISTRLTRNLLIFNPCAQDETRTHTTLLPLPPQSSVYTNFTTCARTSVRFYTDSNVCDIRKIALCPEQDSNLHTSRHTHLKRTRLPIPPPGLLSGTLTAPSHREKMQEQVLHGAMNETRTRDPDLGKVVLYQLSYHRILHSL